MTTAEVKELVERLKDEADRQPLDSTASAAMFEAASALTLLAQEREELREALKPFVDPQNKREISSSGVTVTVNLHDISRARAALKDT